MHSLIDSENRRELDKQEDQLLRKIDEAKKELIQLENNIQFFAHVDEKNPIVREARKNIDRQKEQIELLIAKRKQLKKMRTAPPPPVVEEKTEEAKSEKQTDTPEEGVAES